jgi:hypothetical protein
VDILHVVVGGTASRGRCGGFQWMTGPVFHVSINLTLKQYKDLFSPPLKLIEKPFNFCLKQSALETLETTKNFIKWMKPSNPNSPRFHITLTAEPVSVVPHLNADFII